MERSLNPHIEELERALHQSIDRLMQEEDVRVRNALESKVHAADQALQHFLVALQLEQEVRDQE